MVTRIAQALDPVVPRHRGLRDVAVRPESPSGPGLFIFSVAAHVQYRPGDELGGRSELPHVELDDLVQPLARQKDHLLPEAVVDEQLTTERTARPTISSH